MSLDESPATLTDGTWQLVGGVRKWVPATNATTSRDDLLHAARKSDNKRIKALAAKIATLTTQLERALKDDEADQERRDRIAELEAELRKLKGQKPRKASTGDHGCSECGRSFATVQALRLHERRAHQGFNPTAIHAQAQEAP